jgi:hypothetical protein
LRGPAAHAKAQVINWFEANRAAIAAGTMQHVTVSNLNIPSCPAGAVRSQKDEPLALTTDGYTSIPDCASTVTDPADDIAAYLVGFAPLSQVSAKPAA